jgi:hypothetical protein
MYYFVRAYFIYILGSFLPYNDFVLEFQDLNHSGWALLILNLALE